MINASSVSVIAIGRRVEKHSPVLSSLLTKAERSIIAKAARKKAKQNHVYELKLRLFRMITNAIITMESAKNAQLCQKITSHIVIPANAVYANPILKLIFQ